MPVCFPCHNCQNFLYLPIGTQINMKRLSINKTFVVMWWMSFRTVMSYRVVILYIIMSPHMRKTDGKCFNLYLFCGFQFKKRPHHSTFDSVFIFIPKETQLWKCGLMFFVSIYVTTLPFWWIRETIKFIFNEILYPEPHIYGIYTNVL